MPHLSRRSFLKIAGVAATGAVLSPRSWAQVPGANTDVRIGIAGLGTVGGGNPPSADGRGGKLLLQFNQIPGVRVVALCDPDSAVLEPWATYQRSRGGDVKAFADFRDMIKMNDLDAVIIATPNHLHSLYAVWAMQAGKDVYLEKPVCHNIWEGGKVIEAATKYKRVVQVGSQCRSSPSLAEAVAWVKAGNIGKINNVHGLCYKPRLSLGTDAVAVPSTVNYDLYVGPAPMVPPRRPRFHYEWHWYWDTGNGDVANQGVHQMDVGRWFLGEPAAAPRVISVGGRLGYTDSGETPNTLLAYMAYPKAPLIFEVRGLPAKAGQNGMDVYPAANAGDVVNGASIGVIVNCEGGQVIVPSYTSAQAHDRDGKILKDWKDTPNPIIHAVNFIDVVRSRKSENLYAPIAEGYASSCLAHLGNISYKLGHGATPDAIREQIKADAVLAEAYERLSAHLAANNVDIVKTPVTLGMPLAFDPATGRFTGSNSAAANPLLTRDYRKPYVVPDIV